MSRIGGWSILQWGSIGKAPACARQIQHTRLRNNIGLTMNIAQYRYHRKD